MTHNFFKTENTTCTRSPTARLHLFFENIAIVKTHSIKNVFILYEKIIFSFKLVLWKIWKVSGNILNYDKPRKLRTRERTANNEAENRAAKAVNFRHFWTARQLLVRGNRSRTRGGYSNPFDNFSFSSRFLLLPLSLLVWNDRVPSLENSPRNRRTKSNFPSSGTKGDFAGGRESGAQ